MKQVIYENLFLIILALSGIILIGLSLYFKPGHKQQIECEANCLPYIGFYNYTVNHCVCDLRYLNAG